MGREQTGAGPEGAQGESGRRHLSASHASEESETNPGTPWGHFPLEFRPVAFFLDSEKLLEHSSMGC